MFVLMRCCYLLCMSDVFVACSVVISLIRREHVYGCLQSQPSLDQFESGLKDIGRILRWARKPARQSSRLARSTLDSEIHGNSLLDSTKRLCFTGIHCSTATGRHSGCHWFGRVTFSLHDKSLLNNQLSLVRLTRQWLLPEFN